MAQTKAELVEELGSQASKADLVDLLESRLLKDDLASLLEDDSGATKEELVRKLGNKKKDELVEAVSTHLTKEQIQEVIEQNRDESNDDEQQRGERRERQDDERPQRDESTDIDWSAELDWAPAPRPTPAPVTFVGAAPYQPGQRVRVDVAGLPMLGVFAGKGASAAGTIVGVDARERNVRVYLDAVFDGEKEIVVPPERVTPDG